MGAVLLATWIVDSIRARHERSQPDILCLQELKATEAQFPFDAVKEAGYKRRRLRAEDVQRDGRARPEVLDALRLLILATSPAARACTAAAIDRDERKGQQPSHHAPVLATFDLA